MKRTMIFLLALMMLVMAGCAAQKADEADSFARMEEANAEYMREHYCSMEQASPYIGNQLAYLTESGKPLEKFSAYISEVRENEDETVTLTIDRIAFDEGYEDAALQDRSFIVKDSEGSETVTVARDLYTVVGATVAVSIDDAHFPEYVQKNESYFDFYVCDGAVLFAMEGIAP